jgi:NAD(P)-dependent dehydrogenase (short-subunit alcohol dehydrogenase family)
MTLSTVISAAKELIAKEKKLHALINSAGIMAVPFQNPQDGYEPQWQTNSLAHALLAHHLLPLLLSTAPLSQPGAVRIVNVSSRGHKFAPKKRAQFGHGTANRSSGMT